MRKNSPKKKNLTIKHIKKERATNFAKKKKKSPFFHINGKDRKINIIIEMNIKHFVKTSNYNFDE